jgi:hypothetical protein
MLRTIASLSLISTTTLLTACSDPLSRLLDRPLEGGGAVKDLLSDQRTNVLLVYDATTCFACGTRLPGWLEIARNQPIVVTVVLNGPANEGDLRALRRWRVGNAALLAGKPLRARSVPREYVIERGRVTARAEGKQQVRGSSLWRRFQPDSVTVSERPGAIRPRP